MRTFADTREHHKSKVIPNTSIPEKREGKSGSPITDQRPEAVSHGKFDAIAGNSPQMKKMERVQDFANNSPQMEQAVQLQAMADKCSAALPGRGVIQGNFWKKAKRFFGWKNPQERAIRKAEKKADKLTKKHRKFVQKFLDEMGELSNQLSAAYLNGKDRKAGELKQKIEQLSRQYDEIRDKTEDAVNDFADKVGEMHEQIADLIAQDITGMTDKDKEEVDEELAKLENEMEERKSTIANDDEDAQAIRSEVIEIKEKPAVKVPGKEKPESEKGEYERILDSIKVSPEELAAYRQKLEAKDEEEDEFAEFEMTPEEIASLPLGVNEEERKAMEEQMAIKAIVIPSGKIVGEDKDEEEEKVLAAPI